MEVTLEKACNLFCKTRIAPLAVNLQGRLHCAHFLDMQAEDTVSAHTAEMRWSALTVKGSCGASLSKGFCAGALQIFVCGNKHAGGYDAACTKPLQALMQQRSPPASMVVFMPGAMQVSQA